MYYCEDCNSVFDEPETKTETEPYEFWGATGSHKSSFDVCPYCGSDDISDKQEEIDNED